MSKREYNSCPICLNQFDLDSRLPYAMIPCLHSICHECLKDLQSKQVRHCPIDHRLIAFTEKNFSTIDYITILSQNKGLGEKCPTHNKTLKYFCSDDKEVICMYCVTRGKHKHHDVQDYHQAREILASKEEQIQKEQELKVKQYQDQIGQIEEIKVKIEQWISDQKSQIQQRVVNMQQIINQLIQKQTDLENYNNLAKKSLEKQIFRYEELIQQLQQLNFSSRNNLRQQLQLQSQYEVVLHKENQLQKVLDVDQCLSKTQTSFEKIQNEVTKLQQEIIRACKAIYFVSECKKNQIHWTFMDQNLDVEVQNSTKAKATLDRHWRTIRTTQQLPTSISYIEFKIKKSIKNNSIQIGLAPQTNFQQAEMLAEFNNSISIDCQSGEIMIAQEHVDTLPSYINDGDSLGLLLDSFSKQILILVNEEQVLDWIDLGVSGLEEGVPMVSFSAQGQEVELINGGCPDVRGLWDVQGVEA